MSPLKSLRYGGASGTLGVLFSVKNPSVITLHYITLHFVFCTRPASEKVKYEVRSVLYFVLEVGGFRCEINFTSNFVGEFPCEINFTSNFARLSGDPLHKTRPGSSHACFPGLSGLVTSALEQLSHCNVRPRSASMALGTNKRQKPNPGARSERTQGPAALHAGLRPLPQLPVERCVRCHGSPSGR